MPLETFSFVDSLNPNNPAVTDGLVNGDDHLRGIKLVLTNTFPGATGPLMSTSGPGGAPGSALFPSYAFGQEPSLGFYRYGAGIIAYTGVLLGGKAIGEVFDFAGTVPPQGCLACDGQLLSRTTYAALFAAIGTTWGAGDGNTTFAIPDLRARFRRHRGITGGVAGDVGNTQAPANLTHTHAVAGNTGSESNDHSHTFSGTTGVESNDHSHGSGTGFLMSGLASSSTGGGSFAFTYPPSAGGNTGGRSATHTHAFSGSTGGISANHVHAFSVTSQASGDANEARPYSATVLTCIRAQ